MPKINDFLQGFQDNLPGLKDFRHASRLYIDDNYKLLPKQKFLYHVQFETDEDLFFDGFGQTEKLELNMLVKQCELPRYGINTQEGVQYNKKVYTQTRIQYEPVNITFFDDHADTVNAFWKKYYSYHFADSVSLGGTGVAESTRDSGYDADVKNRPNKFGMDTPQQRKKPYLKRINIFLLHKQRFTQMTLINPKIVSFSHDSVDAADGAGVLQNQMQIMYETVLYDSGNITRNDVPGFAQLHYDKEPSPLTILGGGTNSIFGPGGVVDGVGSAIKNLQSGNILGAILAASNTYNNAKKIKKSDAKEELKGIAKKGVQEIGKQAGNITNPVGQFAVGTAAALATVATTKGLVDNNNRANTTVVTTAQDTVNFLTAEESFQLVNNNDDVKDEIAAGLYYKDIGSRTGQTIAQSNVAFENSSDNVKNVYQAKAITDVRKLVTEGYIKIDRGTQDVAINAEKKDL